MRIVVLVKPVPDTTGQERLGPDLRVDRAAVPAVVNANDEYALEAALKLREAAGAGSVTLLSMAPAGAPDTLRKALAMGADSGVLVTDPVLGGSDALSDGPGPRGGARPPRVRPRPGRRRHVGRRGRRGRGRRGDARRAALPVVRRPDRARLAIGSGSAGSARPATTSSRRRCRRSSSRPRRSASRATRRSRGSWPPGRRRSRPGRWPTLGLTRRRSAARWPRPGSCRRREPPARAAHAGHPRAAPAEAARQVVDFLAERRLI